MKNTLHDDPLPDDGTKMLNLRVNKEESKHRVEKNPTKTKRPSSHLQNIGTDWNWNIIGKESHEYLVGEIEPRLPHAVL